MPQKFRRLFEGPDEIDYSPDPMGRIGEGARDVRDPALDDEGQALFQDFRDAYAQGRPLPELFGPKGTLDIKQGIGLTSRNRRPDVAKVETFLDLLGEHDTAPTEGPTGYYSIRLEDNLKAYQIKNGLKPDGVVNPQGETLGRIKRDLTRTLGPATRKPPRPAAPRAAARGKSAAPRSVQSAVLKGPLDGADLREAPEAGARLIPTQATGGLPTERKSDPSTRRTLTRRDFLEASRDSERRLPDQVKELDQKYRRLLRWAIRLQEITPGVDIRRSIAAMRRYLDGTGGTVSYDPDWIRGQRVIKRAENRLLNHFADWLRGKPLKPGSSPPGVFANILKLKPGASFSDGTERSAAAPFGNPSRIDKTTDFFNLSKDSNIKGFGNFSFARKGNTIHVAGTIEQNWRDKFDFAPGKTIHLPSKDVGVKVVTDELIFLRGVGKARPFQLRSTWRRRVAGEIQVAKNPNTGKNEVVGVTLKWAE